jgi:hypothetical protein
MRFESDPHRDYARQGVSLRGKVDHLVINDFNHAYEVAKSIKYPWYRCQSLAEIAEHSNETYLDAILHESFNTAMMCHHENRRVEVACWPLRVAIQRGKWSLAKAFLEECIRQLNKDSDPISKWCATSILITIKQDLDFLVAFFDAFQSATSKGHGWRVERRIKCRKKVMNN